MFPDRCHCNGASRLQGRIAVSHMPDGGGARREERLTSRVERQVRPAVVEEAFLSAQLDGLDLA